jgi:hypothetical protein
MEIAHFVERWNILLDVPVVYLLIFWTFDWGHASWKEPSMEKGIQLFRQLFWAKCILSCFSLVCAYACFFHALCTKLGPTQDMSETLVSLRWKIIDHLINIARFSTIMNVAILITFISLYGSPATRPVPNTYFDLWPVAILSGTLFFGFIVPETAKSSYRANRYYLTHPPVDGTLAKKKE